MTAQNANFRDKLSTVKVNSNQQHNSSTARKLIKVIYIKS